MAPEDRPALAEWKVEASRRVTIAAHYPSLGAILAFFHPHAPIKTVAVAPGGHPEVHVRANEVNDGDPRDLIANSYVKRLAHPWSTVLVGILRIWHRPDRGEAVA